MGQFLTSYFTNMLNIFPQPQKMRKDEEFVYAVFDPTQIQKPKGRTKDLISSKYRYAPLRLDTVTH